MLMISGVTLDFAPDPRRSRGCHLTKQRTGQWTAADYCRRPAEPEGWRHKSGSGGQSVVLSRHPGVLGHHTVHRAVTTRAEQHNRLRSSVDQDAALRSFQWHDIGLFSHVAGKTTGQAFRSRCLTPNPGPDQELLICTFYR